MNTLINDVISLMNSELVLQSTSVTLDLHPYLPVVKGDSIQLQQVLINLLKNALDAMEDQPVGTRIINVSSRYGNSEGVIVSVSDTGEGIDPGEREAIFEPFETTKTEGTGLGLAICKSIIEAHGGNIWAENRHGKGSIFYFTLPSGDSSE
jgi:signal transduction histidine kinase